MIDRSSFLSRFNAHFHFKASWVVQRYKKHWKTGEVVTDLNGLPVINDKETCVDRNLLHNFDFNSWEVWSKFLLSLFSCSAKIPLLYRLSRRRQPAANANATINPHPNPVPISLDRPIR